MGFSNLRFGINGFHLLIVAHDVHVSRPSASLNTAIWDARRITSTSLTVTGLAQSAERLTAEREVAGSIPGAGPLLRVLK